MLRDCVDERGGRMGTYLNFIGLVILAAFYAVYIGKMILQKRKGIQTK